MGMGETGPAAFQGDMPPQGRTWVKPMSMKSRLKVREPGSKELEGYEVRDRVHDKCVEMVLEEREGRPG